MNTYADYKISSDKISVVIAPGVTPFRGGTQQRIISAIDKKFLWLEGAIDAMGDKALEGPLEPGAIAAQVRLQSDFTHFH